MLQILSSKQSMKGASKSWIEAGRLRNIHAHVTCIATCDPGEMQFQIISLASAGRILFHA
jgi:hypothetical protein